jgi:cysteine-rich repeat protein
MNRALTTVLAAITILGCSPATDLLDMIPQQDQTATEVSEDIQEISGTEDLFESLGFDTDKDFLALDIDDVSDALCSPGEGCFLDPCLEGQECLSGWCVDHMGEGVCTLQCTEECPPGWSCQQVAGTEPDLVFICVSDHANLCRPCATGDNCKSVGGAEDVCVDYDDQGSFCGGACGDDNDCPWGFSCTMSFTIDEIETKQCVADAGVCPCTNKAVELALWTPCELTNEFGTCNGKRICAEAGLTACDANTPSVEICDGMDNDCNGTIDDLLCDDGNACTADTCDPETGCAHEPLEGTTCDDGDVCTLADHCEAGTCKGSAINCDDNNPCTDDACNPTGGCVYINNYDECDDMDPCTVKDTCTDGACSGFQVPCDCMDDTDCEALEDGDMCNGTLYCQQDQVPYKCALDTDTVVTCDSPANPCQVAFCDAGTGLCGTGPADNGLSCDDNNDCTVLDSCIDGECTSGPKVNCNDGNPCTTDLCDPAGGCFHEENALPCNDGNPCTTGDVCQAGECLGTGELPCDDGNICTDDSCNPANGCIAVPNNAGCDDANKCTVTDLCAGGVCKGIGALNCDDDNICTIDGCDPELGCLLVANTQPCDDGDACTTADICSATVCTGPVEVDCNDFNPCTDDSCIPDVGCIHSNNQEPCDDLNTCTTSDMCSQGKCLGDGSLECDDGNSCTKDICLPQGGCQHEATAGSCDDGNPCTVNDSCDEGNCVSGPAPDCDDDNVCTDDKCDDGLCVHSPNIEDCDDGNACTEDDLCAQGKCIAGTPLNCDDTDICTTDSCAPGAGCQYATNSLPCDDDDACTSLDKCNLGQCQGNGIVNCNDGNPCTDDSCSPDTGCVYTNNQDDCFDNDVCTTGDTCTDGSCTPTDWLNCDDSNPCTDDSCDSKIGCIHTPNSDSCDDANACTDGDKCNSGQCVGGPPPACDDSNPCTSDSCSPDSGCVYVHNEVPCDDGEVCTINDKCSNGLCVGGETLACNDDNICTDDACIPGQGCQFVTNLVDCDDDDACTTVDVCAAGQCVGSTPPVCDDGNVCTDDSCAPDTGCVNAHNVLACEDGDACTTDDVCEDGSCTGGPALDCNDNDDCTDNSCSPDSGCEYVDLECCGNGILDPGEACDDGNQVGNDGCSADCTTTQKVHHNGQGVTWYNNVATGTHNSSQAQLSCQKSFGTCHQSGGDCAGTGWCENPQSGKCWGWTSGCSGGPGRVWKYGNSHTTYGTWD